MMKTIALATAVTLASTLAFAQGSGSTMGTGGPDANMTNGGGMNGPTNGYANARRNEGMSGTVGMSRGRPTSEDASNSGAPTAAGVNSKGDMTEPGAVKGGANGR